VQSGCNCPVRKGIVDYNCRNHLDLSLRKTRTYLFLVISSYLPVFGKHKEWRLYLIMKNYGFFIRKEERERGNPIYGEAVGA
jgi:hypothetical protein